MGATLILPTSIIDDLTAGSDSINARLDRFVRAGMIQIRGPVSGLRTLIQHNGADQITAEQVTQLEATFPGDCDWLVNNTLGSHGRHLGLPDWFDVPLALLVTLLNAGGDVVNYPMWIRIPDANLTDAVPTDVGLRYTDVLDQNGVPTGATKTWAEWASVTPLRLSEGGTIRNYISIQSGGTWEIGSVIYALSQKPGAVVRTESQIQALQAAQ